jgi:tetratricopeptide (TPR) repeat protein
MVTPAELCDLAVHCHQQGDLAQAEQLYRQVIKADPGHADAHANLGVALLTAGRKQEALACFRQALRSNPQHFYAHNNLGNALMEQGQMADAVACFRQALRINPNYANAHYNLGNILKDQGRSAEAIDCYREALRVNPDHVDAHNNLGNTLFEHGQLDEAAQCYRQVLRLNPQHANVHNNLGVVLREQGQLAEAALCFRQAMSTDNRNVDAHINLAVIFDRLGQRDEAMDQYEQALRINPRHAITLWNRSLLRLQKGDFEAGWADYEYRWAQPKKRARSFDKPRWDGSPLEGRTILVHAEQGLGDTIQFARYLPLVQKRGGKILYECPPALQVLFDNFPGVEQLVPAGAPLPPFDVQVPLLSLPFVFGTTLATIPTNIPDLRTDPGRLAFWRNELKPLGGFKVGIVWQGNPNNPGDVRRSLPLARFEALGQVQGIKLLSLQVGAGTEQLAAAPFPVTDLGTRFNADSLDDLAAVLMNVDLVVTVETAAAHLAGALERPVWNLLAYNPCWRWLLDRLDTPWYPTMRLFRQSRLGEWGDVFEEVTAALHGLTHQNARTKTSTK